jgi:hypothetical protein
MARAKPPADPAADFHRELRARLDQPDPTAAGQAILELVRSRAAQSENHPADAARAALVARSGLLDRRGRIRTLRSAGLPEPAILEALIAHEARSIGTRNGPRNPAEAAVLAARLLLTMPPPAASTSP